MKLDVEYIDLEEELHTPETWRQKQYTKCKNTVVLHREKFTKQPWLLKHNQRNLNQEFKPDKPGEWIIELMEITRWKKKQE